MAGKKARVSRSSPKLFAWKVERSVEDAIDARASSTLEAVAPAMLRRMSSGSS